MVTYRIAQVNIARMKALLDDPVMASFVARLEEINGLAENSPGFVWRLQEGEGNATYLRPYEDDRILFNMSVWETIDAVRNFVYRTAHVELFRQREAWFEKFGSASLALWWVPSGHLPGVDEAKERLSYLDEHGPTQFAFTLKTTFQPDEEFQQRAANRKLFVP
jgi:heme-degrading monooxygenase HmoA